VPEWLTQSIANGEPLHAEVIFFRLILAFGLGCLVALLYWVTHRRDETYTPSFLSTLVLLCILICMVTQVIGDSVARAFSLVGSLSIVRFRTVVEDTRDTAFVIFTVIVGMAIGSHHLEVALAGLVVVGIAAAVVRPRGNGGGKSKDTWRLNLRTDIAQETVASISLALSSYFDRLELVSASTTKQGVSLDSTYKVRIRSTSSPDTIVRELNLIEGVQSVELRSL
jgi:uncharacterized membrane protein YhiD involved in acid resistance